jgi:hypothetical protein
MITNAMVTSAVVHFMRALGLYPFIQIDRKLRLPAVSESDDGRAGEIPLQGNSRAWFADSRTASPWRVVWNASPAHAQSGDIDKWLIVDDRERVVFTGTKERCEDWLDYQDYCAMRVGQSPRPHPLRHRSGEKIPPRPPAIPHFPERSRRRVSITR